MNGENTVDYRPEGKSIYSNAEYLANNPTWHVEDSPWKAQNIYDILRRNNLKPSRVAEIGCGAGEILVQLKSLLPDSSFVGYEMSEQAFVLARGREREGVHYINANMLDGNVHFDALLCIDVFEHVDDISDLSSRPQLRRLHDLSYPARSVGPVRDARRCAAEARRTVGHLHYFTKETRSQP